MSLSKEINAITECSICTEPFVDPRVLPCVHTFCLKCLESYGRTRKIDEGLACPLCRAKFDTPFSDLPVNFFILKLIDVNKVARKPNENVSCDACSGPNDEEDDDDDDEVEEQGFTMATVYCFDCRQSLCKKCFRVHNKLRHNRCHLVVEFGKKQPDELLKISPTYCEAHQDEIVKFFCSDCQKSICMACYVECHSTHKCGNVAKVAEEFLVQLQEDVTKVTGHIEKCMAEEKELTIRKERFLQLIDNKKVLAKDMMKKMREFVDAHGLRLLDDLASVRSVKLKEFEHAGDEIHDLLAMMDSFKNYSQEVMIKATPADVTRLASMLKKRAAELHAMRLDNDLCTYDLDIHSSSIRQLLTCRDENSVGEVVVYNSRKDNTEAYLASSVASLPVQLDADTGILGMASIGDKLYLLRTETYGTLPQCNILKVYDIKINASDPDIAQCTNPSSIVFLPPMNPTDMVSCSYYDCLYIADQANSSIHRVDLGARLTKWPVQSIPSLLSVTNSHTILVTSTQAAKLLEYTTLGVLLREICLTGVIDRPSHSLEVLKDKFLVLNETELYLVSTKEVETNHAATEGAEKEIDKVDDTTQITEPTEGPEATASEVDTRQEEDGARIVEVKEVLAVNEVEAPALDQTVDNVSGAEATNDANTLKVVAETVAGIGGAGNEPIRTCKDQFGFIFVMTKTKVHLLSPELKYIRELISLDGFGMENPKHIHFQPESGQLYAASTAGTKQFLVFQITEGKVAQSVWKK